MKISTLRASTVIGVVILLTASCGDAPLETAGKARGTTLAKSTIAWSRT
jgi:hypothetical protein